MGYFWRIVFLLNLTIGFQQTFAEVNYYTQLGRSIYEHGIGRDEREITARMHGSINLTGAAVACSGCHGKDARGGGEAFIRASDIRWINLNQPFSARRAGVAEASYGRSSFKRALHAGVSASGRKLDVAMPRFDLADDEVDALIAYLDQIDQKPVEAAPRSVVLGLLPTPGKNPLADALNTKLKHCPASESGAPVAAINMLYFDSPGDAIIQLIDQLKENPHSIVLAPYLIGWEDRYVDTMRSWDISTVLPITFLDQADEPNWHFPFPGIKAQILALVKSVQTDDFKQLYIVYNEKDPLSARMFTFAKEVAHAYRLSLVSSSEANSKALQIPWLWLRSVQDDLIQEGVVTAEPIMLVPALFFNPAHRIKQQVREWRVAYPYQPRSANVEEWRSPVDAWTQAACMFLSLVGSGKVAHGELPEILQWDEQTYLSRKPDFDLLSEQVVIDKIVCAKSEQSDHFKKRCVNCCK